MRGSVLPAVATPRAMTALSPGSTGKYRVKCRDEEAIR